MRKIILAAVVLAGICAFAVYIKKKMEKKQSVVLAAYSYPSIESSYWKAVIKKGGKNIPYVIINPNSGPGAEADLNYARQLKENMKEGIKNIAYIRTNYQKRPLTEVLADVDKYYELYGKNNLNGFFFDEVGVDDKSQPAYMKAIYEYVKSKGKDNIVVANPGRQITDKLAPYADVFVTSEISADEYINRFTEPESEFENNEDNFYHIWHIVYAAKPEQYEQIIKLSRKRNAGWIMVTDDVQPNPYDKLPKEFERIISIVNGKK
jgi:hypothetical protein